METIEEPSTDNDAINDNDNCNMENNATLPSCSQLTVITSDIESSHDAQVKEVDKGEE